MASVNTKLEFSTEDVHYMILSYFSNVVKKQFPGYAGLEIDIKTLRIQEGQRGEFTGLTVELKPKT